MHRLLGIAAQRGLGRVHEEEHTVEAGIVTEAAHIVVEHRLIGFRFHLHEGALTGRLLLQDQIGVLLDAAQFRHSLPAGAREDQVAQHFKVMPVQLLDDGTGRGDQILNRLPR